MSREARILYVEDDLYLSFVTMDSLEQKGYKMTLCKDGQSAMKVFDEQEFDLCILDIMLPKIDGYELAKKIRSKNENIPILFLSAKSLKEDRIKGLQLGADDYITKPFSIEELILRIEVFLKRSKVKLEATVLEKYEIGTYSFYYRNLSLVHEKDERKLTKKEADLLLYFTQNPNVVIKKEIILSEIWGNDSYMLSRSLDVFISRLRKYLIKDLGISIENIHGIGYRLNV